MIFMDVPKLESEEENYLELSLDINPNVLSFEFFQNSFLDISSKEKESKELALIKKNDIDKLDTCPYCGHHSLYPRYNIISANDEINFIDYNKNLNMIKKRANIRSKNKLALGRKHKNDKTKSNHTKFNDDNIIRKIKSYFMNYLTDLLNLKLAHSNKKFLKLDKTINENLCIDYNLKLMKTDISQIFKKYKINKKYKAIEDKMINIHLLNEIYEKNENKDVITILNSQYIDMLKYMREKDLNKFRSYLLKKALIEGDNKENAEKYIDKVVGLLFSFEQWFKNKNQRIKTHD